MKPRSDRISTAVIRRLPRYYRKLSELESAGVVRISSRALGETMGLTASQIRQDLSCFGEFGQQGYGYQTESLREQIGDILGISRGHTVIVMGAGNLGRAILQNFPFSRSGFQVLGAFDISGNVVGTVINGVPVRHADTLEAFLAEHHVDVGVLTVPISAAQATGDRLAAAGVRGIWNFTNCEIKYDPARVIVESVHFSDSLLTLNYLISQRCLESGGEESGGKENRP